jgi:hypothetical protein
MTPMNPDGTVFAFSLGMNNLRSPSPGVERTGYCDHPSARQIRVYMSYADANAIRLRTAQAAGSPLAHVSWLYEIPGGWAWTVCRECPARERRTA